MTALFFRIIEFSVYGTMWVILLFLAGFLAGRKSGVLWKYAASVCIVVHLLIPIHIQWLSVDIPFWQSAVRETRERAAGTEDEYGKQPREGAEKNISETSGGKILEDLSGDRSGDVSAKNTSLHEEQENIPSMTGEEDSGTGKYRQDTKGQLSVIIIAEAVWLLGMLFFFGRTVLSYAAFCKQAKRWSLPAKPLAARVMEDVKEQYGIGRKIALCRNSKVTSPMLYGIIKPVILLPDGEYSRQEYYYIFRHELSHYRHGDVLVKYLFTLCKGIYWFHLPVWWMCRCACAQMEILCDASVIAGKSVEEKRAYSMVILRHIPGGEAFRRVPLTTSFYGGKDYMKIRFKNIMTSKKKAGIGAVLAAVVMVLVIGGVKWSNAAGTQEDVPAGKTGVKQVETSREEVSDQNILVIGTDINGTDEKKQGMADSIMLIQVNAEEGTIEGRNIPRDLLVDFPELVSRNTDISKKEEKAAGEMGKQKLGQTYAVYGYEVLEGAVESLYSVKIDSHIILNYKFVPKIIDAAGGVEITLTKQEADYLNSTNFIAEKKNRNVKAGKQILNGDQATGYMRIRQSEAGSPVVNGKRSTEMDIFGRGQRCKNVIAGFEKQIRKNKVDWADMIKTLVREKEDTELDMNLSAGELVLLVKKVVAGELDVVFPEDTESEHYEHGTSREVGSYLIPKKEEAFPENEEAVQSRSYSGLSKEKTRAFSRSSTLEGTEEEESMAVSD